MSEMIERVAMRLSEILDEPSPSYCQMVARAAIEAMRTPTLPMLHATMAVYNKAQSEEIWGAMIEAALVCRGDR